MGISVSVEEDSAFDACDSLQALLGGKARRWHRVPGVPSSVPAGGRDPFICKSPREWGTSTSTVAAERWSRENSF